MGIEVRDEILIFRDPKCRVCICDLKFTDNYMSETKGMCGDCPAADSVGRLMCGMKYFFSESLGVLFSVVA